MRRYNSNNDNIAKRDTNYEAKPNLIYNNNKLNSFEPLNFLNIIDKYIVHIIGCVCFFLIPFVLNTIKVRRLHSIFIKSVLRALHIFSVTVRFWSVHRSWTARGNSIFKRNVIAFANTTGWKAKPIGKDTSTFIMWIIC